MPLFKQSILLQAVVILLATAALWGSALVLPQPMTPPQGSDVLYGVLYRWLAATPRLAAIIGLLLVVAGGVLFNVLLVDIGLSSQTSLLPTLLYIICMSASAMTLTPMIVVSLLMTGFVRQLSVKGSLLSIPPERACAAAALIGICSMLYLPAALLIVSYLFAAINYRLYTWRDWFVMILGLAAPYVLLATVLMFTDGLAGWWQGVVDAVMSVGFNVTAAPVLQFVGSVLLSVALLAGLVTVWRRLSESTVMWQRNAITVFCVLPGGLAIMAVTRVFPIDMQLYALPFSFGVSCLLMPSHSSVSFGNRKRRDWIYTLILVLIFVAAMIC